jgi:hypothetical protein
MRGVKGEKRKEVCLDLKGWRVYERCWPEPSAIVVYPSRPLRASTARLFFVTRKYRKSVCSSALRFLLRTFSFSFLVFFSPILCTETTALFRLRCNTFGAAAVRPGSLHHHLLTQGEIRKSMRCGWKMRWYNSCGKKGVVVIVVVEAPYVFSYSWFKLMRLRFLHRCRALRGLVA